MNTGIVSSHGTYGSAQQHQRRGEKMCDECRKAFNAHMRAYRSRNPLVLTRDKKRARDRNRALVVLAQRHRDEYEQLMREAIS